MLPVRTIHAIQFPIAILFRKTFNFWSSLWWHGCRQSNGSYSNRCVGQVRILFVLDLTFHLFLNLFIFVDRKKTS